MKPYSQDLRERVIAAIEAGQQALDEIAATFGVSPSTVDKWWRRWRQTGSCAARPHAGGMPRALRGCEAALRAAVREQPDVTLRELCDRVAEAAGVEASSSMMSRELRRLRLPRKKSRSTTASGTRRGSRAHAASSAGGRAGR
jgi:transposase